MIRQNKKIKTIYQERKNIKIKGCLLSCKWNICSFKVLCCFVVKMRAKAKRNRQLRSVIKKQTVKHIREV